MNRILKQLTFALLIIINFFAAKAFTATQRTTFPELVIRAAEVKLGDILQIDGVNLDENRADSRLILERTRVFSETSTIVIDAGSQNELILPPPDNRYFLGTIDGDPSSSAMINVLESGEVRGIVSSGADYWLISQITKIEELQIRKIDTATELGDGFGSFRCNTDALSSPSKILADNLRPFEVPEYQGRSEKAVNQSYTARIAIETDFEFYQLFGSTSAATDYIGDIIAYESGVYSSEIDTSLMVETIYLYTNSGDPWTQVSPACALFEFGRYWNDNRGSVDRTIAHFMSGKNNGGGVAWLGVLCSGPFDYQGGVSSGCPDLTPDTDNYGGGYGYTGTMDGDFDINSPSILWDIVATAHEIGHNFNSPHTHCYGGIGGNADPVDECNSGECGGSGCYCGASSLPGPSGGGSGTIMSYCHLLSPGMSNVSFTFGTGHPYGTAPERVAIRMNDHVVSMASFDPACLAVQAPVNEIFINGFESGDMSAWSASVP